MEKGRLSRTVFAYIFEEVDLLEDPETIIDRIEDFYGSETG